MLPMVKNVRGKRQILKSAEKIFVAPDASAGAGFGISHRSRDVRLEFHPVYYVSSLKREEACLCARVLSLNCCARACEHRKNGRAIPERLQWHERQMIPPPEPLHNLGVKAGLRKWLPALGVSLATALLVVSPFLWLGTASGHDISFHASSLSPAVLDAWSGAGLCGVVECCAGRIYCSGSNAGGNFDVCPGAAVFFTRCCDVRSHLLCG